MFATILVATTGCATLGLGGVNLISIEEEWEMGQELEAQIAQELPVSQDPRVTQIGEQMVAQTELADLPWRFYVVEDESINAFNVPGGLVYVHTGLMESVPEEELAAVIGHEVGHGAARHGTQRLTEQYGLSILAAAVLGQEPGVIEEIVAQVAAAGAIARFSRAQEHEADELGVWYLSHTGYPPEGMVSLLERLMELREREPGAVEQFFATHPDPQDRIDEVEALIREMGVAGRPGR